MKQRRQTIRAHRGAPVIYARVAHKGTCEDEIIRGKGERDWVCLWKEARGFFYAFVSPDFIECVEEKRACVWIWTLSHPNGGPSAKKGARLNEKKSNPP